MSKSKDTRAPDGVVAYGDRLVRIGGKIKYAGIWFQDDRLLPFVGDWVGVKSDGYWIVAPEIWWPTYPMGELIFSIGEKGEVPVYKEIVKARKESSKEEIFNKVMESSNQINDLQEVASKDDRERTRKKCPDRRKRTETVLSHKIGIVRERPKCCPR